MRETSHMAEERATGITDDPVTSAGSRTATRTERIPAGRDE
ncbi:hypothetical protein ACIQEY_04315 [Streptomyces parvus]